MESSSDLKCADFLEILALEPEPDDRLGGFLARPGGPFKCSGRLWGRGEGGEGGVCEHWGLVDVWFYESVGGDDGGTGEGWAFRGVGHCKYYIADQRRGGEERGKERMERR